MSKVILQISNSQSLTNNITVTFPGLHLTPPLGYLEFNYLVELQRPLSLIQEESTLGNTIECPETIESGTNELIGTNPDAIKLTLEKLFAGNGMARFQREL